MTHTLHQLADGRTVLFRRIPESTYKVLYREGMLGPHIICMVERHDLDDPIYYLPDGKYTLISTSDSLTEEQAAGVVSFSEMAHYGVDDHTGGFMDYARGHWGCKTALESFASLLSHLNLTGRHAVLVKSE